MVRLLVMFNTTPCPVHRVGTTAALHTHRADSVPGLPCLPQVLRSGLPLSRHHLDPRPPAPPPLTQVGPTPLPHR